MFKHHPQGVSYYVSQSYQFNVNLYILVQLLDKCNKICPIKNGLKQRDALLPLFLNFALEYAIRRVQVNQDGLKLNGTRQFRVYADDVNILEESIHTVEKNGAALIVGSKETELEVNADKVCNPVRIYGRKINDMI